MTLNTPKTPNKNRVKLTSAVSMNSVECREESDSGDRIRELEHQLTSQQENFTSRMRDMENIIRRQEEMLEKMKNGHIISNGVSNGVHHDEQ